VTVRPALGAGDVYVYAHGNGAIHVAYGDGRSLLAPLGEAVAIAEGCAAAGCTVLVAADDAPLAADAVAALHDAGVSLTPFAAAGPPQTWGDGTDALMEAASLGSDRILEDLLARGADVHRRDASGSTALHHAAANGSSRAIAALAAAGAAVDAPNDQGFTPLMLATSCRQLAAADQLAALGADPGRTPGGPAATAFPPGNRMVVLVWAVPLLFVLVAVPAFWPLTPFGAVLALAYVVAYLAILPPRAFWRAGVPVRLEGTDLVVRPALRGPARVIDLRAVETAGMGGSLGPSAWMGARWILLGHPDGVPVTRRGLRRLVVPRGELDALAARVDRVVVVPVSGGRTDEVIVPVGNLLSARGVDLSASLRQQLESGRRRAAAR